MNVARWRWLAVSIFIAGGCGGNEGAGSHNPGSGGSGSGGRSSGGAGAIGTGGSPATGGALGSGGILATGGTNAAGGAGGQSTGAGGSAGKGEAGAGNGGAGAKGGGGAGAAAAAGTDGAHNVVPVIVDSGPSNIGTQDVPFISVTVCVPGTTTCATVDHVSVDTGSTGLRLIASALPKSFNLPQQMTGGAPEAECFTFADGFVWGSVRLADLRIGGESANNMQLQLIGDPAYPSVPSDCQATGSAEDTVAVFGANGIMGISQWQRDCGAPCAQVGAAGYYACHGATCSGVAVPVANQIANPVTVFQTDNNGAILSFPSVPESGMATLTGTLTFGVGTQTNNALGNAHKLTVDADNNLGTVYQSKSMTASFIDSGTSLLAFNDTKLTQCGGQSAGFYCPTSVTSETATITGRNNVSTMVTFSVGNADTLFKTGFSAFDNLAGTGSDGSFDWGFPFFIGRKVFVGFASASSAADTGYVAY